MARKETKRTAEPNGQVTTSAPEVSDQSVRELAQVFKLLSDETRLRVRQILLHYRSNPPISALIERPHNSISSFVAALIVGLRQEPLQRN